MPKTNPNLQPERYEPVVFTWHSALLVGTIVLAVVNSVKEVNYFVLAAESAVGVISAYFTAKTLGHNYYVEKRNKVRGGLQRELENAKGAIGISDELQDQDIRVNLAEMGNISRKMTDRQMMQKYSQNYTTQNHRRLERALNEVESLTALELRQKTVPHQAMPPSIPFMIFGVGGTLVFLDYFLFRNIGFEIGGFSSLVAGSSIFGARASTNEEIDRIHNLSRRSQGRDRGGERDIGKSRERSNGIAKTHPLEDILITRDDITIHKKKEKDTEIDYHEKLRQIRDEKRRNKPVSETKPKSATNMVLTDIRMDNTGKIIRSYVVPTITEEDKEDDHVHRVRKTKNHRPKSAPPRLANDGIGR